MSHVIVIDDFSYYMARITKEVMQGAADWSGYVVNKVKPGQEYLALRPKPRITDLRSCSARRGRS